MPRYGNRSSFLFPRFVSSYWIINLLINIGIIAILIALFLVAMPYIILLVLLLAGKYFIRGRYSRRYYGGRW